MITEAESGVVVVSPGDRVTLFCAVDDDYEWCKFYHPSGEFVILSGRGVRTTLPCRSAGCRGGWSFMENMRRRSVGSHSGLRREIQEFGGEAFSKDNGTFMPNISL